MKNIRKINQVLRNHKKRVFIWLFFVILISALLALQYFKVISPFYNSTKINELSFLFIIFVAFSAEYMDSAMGMGYGTTISPILLILGFEPKQVVPSILISEILTGGAAVFFHHYDGNFNLLQDKEVRKSAFILLSLSAIGSMIAAAVSIKIPEIWMILSVGIILTSVGFFVLFSGHKERQPSTIKMLLLGLVASFNKALSGGGYGPLVSGGQVAFGVNAKKAVGITSFAETFTCIVAIIVYNHFLDLDLTLALPLSIGALLSVPFATITVKYIPEKFFRQIIGIMTILFGFLLIFFKAK